MKLEVRYPQTPVEFETQARKDAQRGQRAPDQVEMDRIVKAMQKRERKAARR